MTIITVISQQPLTTEQVNSFRSVPLGIDLLSSGDGTHYLADDGTYKTVSVSQVNADWNSVSGVSQILNKPTLGTSSSLNVPVSGNAASGEVVKGNDTRLSDARTPTAHSHTIADVTGLQTTLDGKQPSAIVLTNTTASFTTTLETKLNSIATGATANSSDATLLSRTNHTGTQLAITISDFATAADARVVAGITGKEDTITAGTTAQYWRGDKSWQTLNSTSVGLGNVNNTSDANKPVSTATQTALNLKYDASNPSGYTTNTGTVTTASVVSANGFAGSVATAGTTPAITISTTITGLLKGNGTAISAATAGTDYLTPTGNGGSLTNFTSGQITTALGYTPYNATNPSGYTTNTGTVTTASIVTANGFSGSVANATTTPAITLTLQNATTSQNGQLTSTDWNTFNGKQVGDSKLTSISALSGASTGLIKLTNGVASFDSNSYLTGNQTITVTGDVGGSGATTITLTLGNNVVTNAKLAQVATATFKGRITASIGNVEDLTATQATSLLDVFTTSSKGLVGASGGGTANFLRADGTWTAPPTTNTITVDVDFGNTFTDRAQVVVTGQPWVTTTSNISCQVLCPPTDDPDELYLLNIKPVISSLVNGTGFTLTLYSEQEAKGIYKVMCVGV